MNYALIMLVVIAAVIIVGFLVNVNTGLLAMAAAYIVGSFLLGIKPTAIQAYWPVKIFFVLFSVSFFYNYATNNGSLEKLANLILYKFGKNAKLFPFVLFFAGWVMCAAGAGSYSIIALLAPIGFILGKRVHISKLLIAMSIYYGAVGACAFPTCSTGATQTAVIAASGYEEMATTYALYNTAAVTAFFFISLVILYFVLGGHKVDVKSLNVAKPESFTKEQKTSLGLILIFVLVLLAPYILGLMLPGVPAVKKLMANSDVAFTAIILSIAATLLKVGNEKKALFSVPWNTIVMICGIGILVELAVTAGTIDMVVEYVSSINNGLLVPIVMSVGAGIMSIFSSTTGVVVPTLYPTVAAISGVSGISHIILLMVILMGSVATGMSPFSACGSIILGCAEEGEVKSLYKQLLAMVPVSLLVCVGLVVVLSLL